MKINRKYLLAVCGLGVLAMNIPVFAAAGQWSSSGNIIYYNDGNVGLGTSSPASKLDVRGSITLGTGLVNENNYLTLRGPNTPYGVNSNQGIKWKFSSAGEAEIRAYRGISWDTHMDFITNGSSNLNPQVRMQINGDGNVGIGMIGDNLSKRFMVRGQSEFRDYSTLNSGDSLVVMRAYYNTPNANSNLLVVGGTGASNWEKFIVKTNGNAYLDGKLTAKSIVVKSNAWADYVFEDGYQLKALKEVKDYITVNKHLPNIPSATEVKENGISVGEMQQKQMEKIEELTLYILQLDERINKLEQENSELQSKLTY